MSAESLLSVEHSPCRALSNGNLPIIVGQATHIAKLPNHSGPLSMIVALFSVVSANVEVRSTR